MIRNALKRYWLMLNPKWSFYRERPMLDLVHEDSQMFMLRGYYQEEYVDLPIGAVERVTKPAEKYDEVIVVKGEEYDGIIPFPENEDVDGDFPMSAKEFGEEAFGISVVDIEGD